MRACSTNRQKVKKNSITWGRSKTTKPWPVYCGVRVNSAATLSVMVVHFDHRFWRHSGLRINLKNNYQDIQSSK